MLDLPADAPLMQTVALKPGVGFSYTRHDLNGERGELTPKPAWVSLRLSPPVTHAIRVVTAGPDGTAVPVAGATVGPNMLWLPGEPFFANIHGDFTDSVTGRDGVALFDWLPADSSRPIDIGIYAEGFAAVQTIGLREGDDADHWSENYQNPAPLGGEHVVTLERLATLAGTVSNPDGSPAAGVMVRVEGSAEHGSDYTRADPFTDEAGRWEAEVDGGRHYLVVPLPGSPEVYEETLPDDALAAAALGRGAPISVAAGETLDGLDFTLAPGVVVTGVVTRGGVPVADETVGLNLVGPKVPGRTDGRTLGLPRWTKTDAAGRYAYAVGPGRFEVYTFGRAGGAQKHAFDVVETRRTVTCDFTLDAAAEAAKPLTLTGRVNDEFGIPLTGIAVTVADELDDALKGAGVTVTSGEDGSFTLERASPNGWTRWGLVASGADEYRGQVFGFERIDTKQDDLTALAVTVNRLSLVTGAAGVKNGPPLAGIPVQLVMKGQSSGRPAPFVFDAVTGPGGQFTCRGAVAGTDYFLRPDVELIYVGFFGMPDVAPEPGTFAWGRQALAPAGTAVPDSARRRGWAFAEPTNLAGELSDLKTNAATLDRRVLLLVADPETPAGADLFAAVYDGPASKLADAGYLTRCLRPTGPSRTAGTALPGRDGVPGDAATLTALSPDGAVLGVYRHAEGERQDITRFLKSHAP